MLEAVGDACSRWNFLIHPKNLGDLRELLPPPILYDLNEEDMEALLAKLPQMGAIKSRQPGSLRIVSLGYHAHIQGNDPDSPYPVDFFVRVGGVLSAINLVLRLPYTDISTDLLLGQTFGPELDLIYAMRQLNGSNLGLKDLELIQQKMYRPCVPNKFHWTSPGGVQDLDESASTRGLLELYEEVNGLTVIASRELLKNREYQGGNIPEYHSVNGVLCIGEPEGSDQGTQEGVTDFCKIPLLKAVDWFDDQCKVDILDPQCNLPGGKTEHALLKFLHLCRLEGIT